MKKKLTRDGRRGGSQKGGEKGSEKCTADPKRTKKKQSMSLRRKNERAGKGKKKNIPMPEGLRGYDQGENTPHQRRNSGANVINKKKSALTKGRNKLKKNTKRY